MSILLMLLAGVVVYYLYITLQEYLKHPTTIKPKAQEKHDSYALQTTPYNTQSPTQKLIHSYEGASISLLAHILQASLHNKNGTQAINAHFSPLQYGLIDEFIHTLSINTTKAEIKDKLYALLTHYVPSFTPHNRTKSIKQEAKESLEFDEQLSISTLAEIFLDNTYGEYKKRLQFVGFLLMLAWSDKELHAQEKEVILDIAAFLELDNDDFNALYEDFTALSLQKDKISQDIAISSIDSNDTSALEKLWQESSSHDEKSLLNAFFALIQKLCANARKKDKSQALLLTQLLQSEQEYNALQHQFMQTTIDPPSHIAPSAQTSQEESSSTQHALLDDERALDPASHATKEHSPTSTKETTNT